MLKLDNNKIDVSLKLSPNGKNVRINADGKILRAKSTPGCWKYIYRFKLFGNDEFQYFTTKSEMDEKKLPKQYTVKMIESISFVEIDYSKDGPHFNPAVKQESFILLTDRKPETGQRVRVLCKQDDFEWQDESVFLGTRMACEYNGNHKVLGWLPI